MKLPPNIAALPQAPEGREYLVLGRALWARDPNAIAAWRRCLDDAGTEEQQLLRVVSVLLVRAGTYVYQDGEIANDDGPPAATWLLRRIGKTWKRNAEGIAREFAPKAVP